MALPTAQTLNYDPNLPVYVEPTTITSTETPLGELPKTETLVDPQKATVAGQLGGILSSGSPVLQAAQAQSNQAYNARGLLQSQGGARAGTAAMIDKAMPIAQQDAGLYGDMAKAQQKTIQDAALNSQIAGIEHKKSLNNARITGALTSQEAEVKFEHQKLADTSQLQRLEVDNQWKQQINYAQLDVEETKGLLAVQSSLASALTGSIERLLRDPNITDKTAAVEALMVQYRSQLSTAASIANIPLSWT